MSINIDFQNRESLTFEAFCDTSTPSWLKEKQKSSFEKFQCSTLPNRKVEHWKYNDMSFLQNFVFTKKQALNKKTSSIAESPIPLKDSLSLVFIDGFLVSDVSVFENVDGLTITNFTNASAKQQEKILATIEPEFTAKNLLMSLNEALSNNSYLIEVEAKKNIQQPIYIQYLSTKKSEPNLTNQSLIIDIEQSASATLIEHFSSEVHDNNQLALQQTYVTLNDNSVFNHYRLNLEDDSAKQVSQVKTTLKKDSVVNAFYLGFGSQLNRTDIDMIHAGSNAECNLTGIYLPANQQTIDYHSNIEHRVPHCNTNEVFRGIIADQAKATFNGKIHILKDAQKSDARLDNKNLLLTNQAEINTKPELEIYADDVSCAHGATVAQLDKKSLYYMKSRGISEKKAHKMLSFAFIQELLNEIKIFELKDYLDHKLDLYMTKLNQSTDQ